MSWVLQLQTRFQRDCENGDVCETVLTWNAFKFVQRTIQIEQVPPGAQTQSIAHAIHKLSRFAHPACFSPVLQNHGLQKDGFKEKFGCQKSGLSMLHSIKKFAQHRVGFT